MKKKSSDTDDDKEEQIPGYIDQISIEHLFSTWGSSITNHSVTWIHYEINAKLVLSDHWKITTLIPVVKSVMIIQCLFNWLLILKLGIIHNEIWIWISYIITNRICLFHLKIKICGKWKYRIYWLYNIYDSQNHLIWDDPSRVFDTSTKYRRLSDSMSYCSRQLRVLQKWKIKIFEWKSQ